MQEQDSSGAAAASAAAAAASSEAPAPPPRKTKKTKKRKQAQEAKSEDGGGTAAAGATGGGTTGTTAAAAGGGRAKKPRSKGGGRGGGGAGGGGGGRNSNSNNTSAADAAAAAQQAALNAAQQAVNEQMLRALEEDQYSAAGSIVDTESDEEDEYMYRGKPVRLDRSAIQQTIKKMAHLERMGAAAATASSSSGGMASMGGGASHAAMTSSDHGDKEQEDGISGGGRGGINKKKQKKKDEHHSASSISALMMDDDVVMTGTGKTGAEDFSDAEEDLDRDGGSIFGATAGSSNSTWVECDKCKKWRRLRGVVDEKKLPLKWYCSMNRNDPERARCSAPEEEYDTLQTPESAADSKARKHLRVWVRRLQCNEAYEARQPTLTRGKKRATASSSKDPYEWVRCCNPSCGKWRAVLRIMDAKSSVIDRTKDGEWYCVMNTWDEKTASCAAPQENLPAVGCPPWIMQDEE